MRRMNAMRWTVGPIVLAASMLVLLVVPVRSQQLFGCDNSGRLFVIDTATGAGSLVCMLPTFPDPGATEIEYNELTGLAFVQGRDGVFAGQGFSMGNCAGVGALVPTGDLVFNGLEFVDGVLYGTAVDGQCLPSHLATLDPASGVSVPIGATGQGPIAGLAWSPAAQTLYGVTGCQQLGLSKLVSIDMGTGAATVIGSTGRTLGSLEFGPDDVLYAGGDSKDGGKFYAIDPATGASTLVGPTGFTNVTGLMLAFNPVPVLISTFDADAVDGGVRLSWTLHADEPVTGFRIYRRLPGQVLSRALPPDGLIAPDRREYVDRDAAPETTYEYTLAAVLPDGEILSPSLRARTRGQAFALHQNTPNPFNPITTVSFTLARSAEIVLAVYDVNGRPVKMLAAGLEEAGYHEVSWDGKNADGALVGSGLYFCRLTSGKQTQTMKMLLLK